MKTAIFPGSFNPVHKGHIKIAESIIESGLADRIIIVATGDYWYKTGFIPTETRIKMLRLFETEKIIIETEFNDRPYTYLLMREMQKRYPDDELWLVMGADNIIKFDEWREYKELLNYGFIIVGRNDTDVENRLFELGKTEGYVIAGKISDDNISSSEIRELCDRLTQLIDPKVLQLYAKYLENRHDSI